MPELTKAKPNPNEIVIEGDLTIANAHNILDLLKNALEIDACDTLIIGEVTGLDLTCLQLLCAFHRSATKLGRNITMNGQNSPRFLAFKHAAGFERHQGCSMNPNKNCLWIKETLNE